jgi:FkbM family methyltransferase
MLYKYLPRYVTNNRFFENCISYINPKYIFFFKLKDMIYEYPLPIIIATLIKEGDIVVDIGANQGQYTIFLSKLVGQKGKVYAFEPDPRNFLILKHRTRKLKNVIIERSAVGNKKSKVKFYLDKFMGMSTIYKDAGASPITCLEIDMVSLDDYFKGFKGDIALIKMDVQGSEPLVLNGMKDLIKKVKVLIFEFWPLGIKAAGFDPFSFIERMISNNFELIYIDENFNSFNINELYDKINDKESLNIIAINRKYLNI